MLPQLVLTRRLTAGIMNLQMRLLKVLVSYLLAFSLMSSVLNNYNRAFSYNK